MTGTTPPVAWTQRLVARSRRLLAVGAASALLTAGLVVYLARDDGYRRYPVAASATAVPLGGATYTLVALHRLSELPGRSASTKPVSGAVFVVADVDVDASALDDGCLMYLVAGDYSFIDELAYTPANDAVSTVCRAGMNGRVSMAFQVPERLLDQVNGVRIEMPGDDRPVSVILPGTPS